MPTVEEREHLDSAIQQMMAEVALKQMREAFDGRLVLYKGLELASRYEDPSGRCSRDIDVITNDPHGLHGALLALGYQDWDIAWNEIPQHDLKTYSIELGSHQLWPLVRPGWPVVVEVHRSPGWLSGMTPPSTAALLENAVPSRVGIDGIETLDPAAHAVCVAVHSWRDRPFARERDLLDIELLLESPETIERADRLASQWGVGRIWRWYQHAIAVAAGAQRPTASVRLLGGHRYEPGSRSSRRDYLVQHLGPFFVDHPFRQLASILQRKRAELKPLPGEHRRDKATRIARRVVGR